MTPIRILVADDHPLTLRGTREFLEMEPGWKVIAEASDGREALEKAKSFKPDVAVLDISLPEMNGLEAAREILKAVPSSEVLILTLHDSEEMIHRALEAGARGYVLKSDAEATLVAAVKAVSQHKAFFTSSVASLVLGVYLKGARPREGPNESKKPLSARERQIVQLLAESKSNKEIADTLDISAHTVATHRSNIMRKLEVHSIGEVVHYAIRNQIVQP